MVLLLHKSVDFSLTVHKLHHKNPTVAALQRTENRVHNLFHIVTADAFWVVCFTDSHVLTAHIWENQTRITRRFHDDHNPYPQKDFIFYLPYIRYIQNSARFQVRCALAGEVRRK